MFLVYVFLPNKSVYLEALEAVRAIRVDSARGRPGCEVSLCGLKWRGSMGLCNLLDGGNLASHGKKLVHACANLNGGRHEPL